MKLRITRHAQQDLREIRTTIAADNPAAANRVVDAICDTLNLLSRYPKIGALNPELGEEVRAFPAQRPAQRYVIFFQIDTKFLLIKRILHGSRDAAAAFEE